MPYEMPSRQAANSRSLALVGLKSTFARYMEAKRTKTWTGKPHDNIAIDLMRGLKSAGLTLDDVVPHGSEHVETVKKIKDDAQAYLRRTGQKPENF